MSNLYAIKEETLSALGDTVRNKVLGSNEFYISGSQEFNKTPEPLAYISFSATVKKMKIKGFTSHTNETVSTPYYLSIAPAIHTHVTNAIQDPNRVVIDYYGDFEIIINSNVATLSVQSYGYFPDKLTLSYEVWGLDENGNEFKYTPLEMVDAINGLDTIPSEALTITGECSYRFAYDGWNWLINQFGDKITTKNITSPYSMFYYASLLIEIPFDINITTLPTNFTGMFYSNQKLKSVPYIIGPERTPPASNYSGCLTLNQMFFGCHSVRNIPNDYFWKIVPNKDFWDKCAITTTQNYGTLFQNCYSLREYPDISMLGGIWTSAYSNVYYNLFNSCCALDKIENLLVLNNINSTSNYFNSTFYNCNRVKEITFETNEDGTPKTAKWKSQTIDLTNNVGYIYNTNYIFNYNSGITKDKEVKDDATYQTLKNDPDWFSLNVNYSRYNHDSAVNTINSLPDCSATGTNTIKFKGASGALTDGGAINTLTEEEIAVAVAKGWVVAFA